jgi:N-acetylated-alpha-linked acidic dipeptidase
VVAISWGEARHVLAALGGAPAPPTFQGGIPVEYRLGPGPATLRVAVDLDDALRPIHNIVATLRGRVQPERVVLLGGHHDAWTFGGVDPGTATAAMLELARVLGQMARQGVRPQRSIQLGFWDAEEYGLIGSTEHAEQFRRELQQRLVLYVNTDMSMRGRFDPGGVPSLADFVIDVARSVPSTGSRSVFDDWVAATTADRRRADGLPDIKPLGSGADFVPFQDHLAVPTLAIEFIGANGYGYGTYHSNYDSRAYVEQVADPGFQQGAILARTLGTLALRMANAHVLPFRFAHYGEVLLAAVNAASVALHGTLTEAQPDPTQRLRTAAERVVTSARALQVALDARLARGEFAQATARELNDCLARIEQRLADDEGTPERAWYRHVFHGWNIYSLYDGQPFPGLAEAMRTGDTERIGIEIGRIEGALERMAGGLEEAHALVDGTATPDQS